jgi:t-SNARE complex subunit (syntaxin)
MFIDFALIIDINGNMLNIIENNVNNTSEYIDIANKDMVEANNIQINIRKKQCCFSIIILTIIGIIITFISIKLNGSI